MTWQFPERTKRKPLSTRERTKIFIGASGLCAICGGKIHPGQTWHVEHWTPLWQGGSDDREALAPVHAVCHAPKTAAEASQRAKEERIRAKHIGSFQKSGPPMPGTKRSGWKKKLDGTIERRG